MLVVFARPPIEGQVKSRLAATIGAIEALKLYRSLLSHTLEVAGEWDEEMVIAWTESTLEYASKAHWIQQGNDLGEKMAQAFERSFLEGSKWTLLIGTDCPKMSIEILSAARQALSRHDVVIGPAADGGYYLIGMKKPYSLLFHNMAWSTPLVFERSLDRCRVHGLSVATLPVLSDIDDEADLQASDWKY